MHVLITRPERDAADLKSRIEALGCTVTLAPLLEIDLGDIRAGAFDGASGIVATSRNGLRALVQSPALQAAKDLPVFVVGPATARLAREIGFQTVIEGQGTAADLVPVIVAHCGGGIKTLAHLAGDHLAFDLARALGDHGISLVSVPAYRSVAAKTLKQPALDLIAAGAIDAVILMSPRSARTWQNLTQALPGPSALTAITHICLSQAVAEGLQPSGRFTTEIAALPTIDEIVALVYRLAGNAKTG